jgi:Tol biopolymer transport system component
MFTLPIAAPLRYHFHRQGGLAMRCWYGSLSAHGLILLLVCGSGCAVTREVIISTKPADADISIDGQAPAKAPVTQTFSFATDIETHSVTARRFGYKDSIVTVSKDDPPSPLYIELHPLSKRVNFTVVPVPGIISIDGKMLSPDPVSQTSTDMEFSLDAQNHWVPRTVTVERPGFKRFEQKVNWGDASTEYVMNLDVMRKDLVITTTPAGAQVSIGGESLGNSPINYTGFPFPVKPDTNEWIPQRVHVTKAGYDPVDVTINWDEGKKDYHIDIPPKSKTVRIVTKPPGAVVKIDGVAATTDASGATTAKIIFPPTDEKGTLRTYAVSASKAASEAFIWEPLTYTLRWDEGKTDYELPLKEIKTRNIDLLRVKSAHGDQLWQFTAEHIPTIAMKDTDEAGNTSILTKLTDLPKGSSIDTLTVSPDGASVLFTVLSSNAAGTDLTSGMMSVRMDGSAVTTMFDDGKSLDLTPSFTPDGSQIVFSSNRGGRRLSIWEMSAAGDPGVTQLTNGEESDLWPMVDSDPKPRLFYESLVDTRADPRLYMTQLGATTRTDLTRSGGLQPRVSPKGDSILFTGFNEKTGKRQIFRMPDRGGVPVTLSSPDADEFDAVWSQDGTKIAYVSDKGTDDDGRNNYDIWVIDVAQPDRPIRITRNGSWDDCPAWDPSGKFICFRSNRGGSWNIWKIAVK